MKNIIAILTAVVLVSVPAFAEDSAEDLAKQLSNPVAALISIPFQLNYDTNIGLDEDGSIYKLNIQPVIPFSLSENWNLISRTILPVVDQTDIPFKGEGKTGLGDIVQSLFFSPKAPTSRGWIWAVGPVFMLPTATDETLGAKKWGIGPTALALKQTGPWTFGALTNHIESVAGDSDRADISATFIQPFVSFLTKTKTTLALNLESTYDWESEQWAVPINFTVSQMLMIGGMPVSIGGGVRYWADSPEYAADEWGGRVMVTLLFPK